MPSIMGKMNVITRCATTYRGEHTDDQLPAIYHSYVFAICKNPGMTQDALSKYLCLGKSNVTRHLATLEAEGFVERKVGERDRREMLVYPTEKMLALLPQVRQAARAWSQILQEEISQEDIETFYKVLSKMAERSRQIVYGEG